ncbi:Rho GTPase-activating protein 20 [Camelus dromedarius]|uniref:Rho GTPase-activating protein 20 n=1 Tax=Camelus dromedarius TaxID=9838 RepID=A0A5N4EH69_CAMDR|nr:Rho GTPase-activating protein 20 [Camelus dromedarius]
MIKVRGGELQIVIGDSDIRHINLAKEKDQPKRIPLKTFPEDIKNCAWCSSTRQDNQCSAPPTTKLGQLFGVPLMDVCNNDNLPTPVLDFLRNIHGSAFSASLYDKWLSVLDQGNEEEKITATQRLLDQLPKAKVVLLRYLFGVLCNIEQYSSPNQMTAYNLSVCIAPSILCAPNANSSESEKDFTKKISFVKFFIENCLKIFGEDITPLLGERSASCDNGDVTSNSEKATGTQDDLIGFGEKDSKAAKGHGRSLDSAILEPKAHPKGNDFHLLQVRGGFTLLGAKGKDNTDFKKLLVQPLGDIMA